MNNLLHQIATNPEHQVHGSVLRGVAADALDEVGRGREAGVLRDHPHPVHVHNGRVIRGYPLPRRHREAAATFGTPGGHLHAIAETGHVNGATARGALDEIDDARTNVPDLDDPATRNPLDRLEFYLSRVELGTADEMGDDEPEPDAPGPDDIDHNNTRLSRRRVICTPTPSSPKRYGAYRVPAGGMVSRGTSQTGGQFGPDMTSAFMNPPATPPSPYVKGGPHAPLPHPTGSARRKLAEGEGGETTDPRPDSVTPRTGDQGRPARRRKIVNPRGRYRGRGVDLQGLSNPPRTTGASKMSRRDAVTRYAESRVGTPLHQKIHALRPELAKAAQEVYDSWGEGWDDEMGDPELGFGGICQDIACAMGRVLSDHGIDNSDAMTPSHGDQHVWAGAYDDRDFYHVDIHPHHYETGGGYNWKKKPGVVFTPDHVSIEPGDRSHHIDENGEWIGD